MGGRVCCSFLIAAIAMATATTGCIGWYGGTATTTTQSSGEAKKKKKIAVAISFVDLDRQRTQSGELEGPRADSSTMVAKETPRALVTRELEGSLEALGFSEVTDNANPDLFLDLLVETQPESDSGLVYGFLAFLTLSVLPLWWSNSYTIHATLHDSSGRAGTIIGQRVILEHVTKLAELLLLPAIPFAPPFGKDERMWRTVSRDVASWVNALSMP